MGDVCRVPNSYETRSNKGKQRLGSGHCHPAQQSTEAGNGGDHSLTYSESKSMEILAIHQIIKLHRSQIQFTPTFMIIL